MKMTLVGLWAKLEQTFIRNIGEYLKIFLKIRPSLFAYTVFIVSAYLLGEPSPITSTIGILGSYILCSKAVGIPR